MSEEEVEEKAETESAEPFIQANPHTGEWEPVKVMEKKNEKQTQKA